MKRMEMISPLRTMKKVVLCAMLMMVCANASAQNKDFEKLAKIDGVEYEHLNKEMIREAVQKKTEQLDQVGGITFDKVEIRNNIASILDMDDLMVFSCKEEKAVEELKKSVQGIVKGDGWESILDINAEDGQMVKIYQNTNDGKKTSVIFGSSKDDTQLMVIEGSLSILQMMQQLQGIIEGMK